MGKRREGEPRPKYCLNYIEGLWIGDLGVKNLLHFKYVRLNELNLSKQSIMKA